MTTNNNPPAFLQGDIFTAKIRISPGKVLETWVRRRLTLIRLKCEYVNCLN